jgi:hypothetical protein
MGTLVERLPSLDRILGEEPNRRRIVLSITPPGMSRGIQLSKDAGPSLQRCGCELWGLVVNIDSRPLTERDDAFSYLVSVSGGRRQNVFGVDLLDASTRVMTTLMLSQYKVTYQHPDTRQPLSLRVGVRSHQTGMQIFAPAWIVP